MTVHCLSWITRLYEFYTAPVVKFWFHTVGGVPFHAVERKCVNICNLLMSRFEFSILDVLPGLSDVILLHCLGKDGGSAQCSGVAGHSLRLVHCM